MPETPEEFYSRAAGALRTPEVETWDTWPFQGPVAPRPLEPPVESESPRQGEGGVDCRRCAAVDDEYIWTNERWRLYAIDPPNGLPVVILLEPREHIGDPGDLSEEMAAELGILIGRIELAIRSVDGRRHPVISGTRTSPSSSLRWRPADPEEHVRSAAHSFSSCVPG